MNKNETAIIYNTDVIYLPRDLVFIDKDVYFPKCAITRGIITNEAIVTLYPKCYKSKTAQGCLNLFQKDKDYVNSQLNVINSSVIIFFDYDEPYKIHKYYVLFAGYMASE